jgi:hypothetical protein
MGLGHGNIEVRRSLLRMVIDHILILPPRRGATKFDPNRVDIHEVEELKSDATLRRIVNAVLRAR